MAQARLGAVSPVGTGTPSATRHEASGPVRCGRWRSCARSSWTSPSPMTKVRARALRHGCLQPRGPPVRCRASLRPSSVAWAALGASRHGDGQAGVEAADVAIWSGCGIRPSAARLGRQRVGDRAEDDDREDADDAVEQGDRGRLRQRHAVGDGQDADDAGLDDAEPGRAERHGRQQRADEGHEDRARQAERHVVEAERLDDEVQAQRLGQPDRARSGRPGWAAGAAASAPNTPCSKRSYSSRTWCGRKRSATMIRRPKLRIVNRPTASSGDDHDADAEHDLDRRRQAVAEAPVARGEAEQGDREEVEDPLDEDRPERPATATPCC